ncbi:MAG: hypothetical protein E6734_07075 [Veillonella dispar]|uniref:hypothetical protein n=1 Tax=Veillonella dispar TaxID=39778 RepID=UPI0028FE840B|nr:hypothetical protein [Veillonella dispar]MDU1987059.1 hypothetical protein [Veillonella dispar]
METSVEKIKYYDSSDLAYDYMIERAIQFVDQYGESPNFNNINLVLAAYNVYLLLTKAKLKSAYLHYASIAKTYIKHCDIYFSNLNNDNIKCSHNIPMQLYQEDYWQLFNNTKLYYSIDKKIVKFLLYKLTPSLTAILKHPQIVNVYSREITCYIIKNQYSILFILDYYFTYNKESTKKFILPKELTSKILLWLINKKLSSNNISPQYLRLIENSTNSTLIIPDKMKVKAKRCRKQIESEILSTNSSMISNMKIVFKNIDELIKIDFQPPNLTITLDKSWIDENNHNDYLFANLFIFYFICDINYRAKFIANKTDSTKLEDLISKPLGLNDYFQPLLSRIQEDLAHLFIMSYDKLLLTQNKRIEDLLKWFYTEFIAEEFHVHKFIFNSSSTNTTFIEKCRNLCSEIDSILKQYQLYYENNDIDRDLLEINSKPLLFSQLESYDKNKYAYIVDTEYINSMNLLFSDQSYLNLITKLLDTNKTFISEIINPTIDLFLTDFDESQKKLIKKLQQQQLIILNQQNQIIAKKNNIEVLKDFYENSCICNKAYQKQLNKLNIECKYTNSLFSTSEVDYLNFILNKKQFPNGHDLRNKYIHGSQSQNEISQLNDYYLLLMIHCFIALKIYDELANRKSIYTKS